MKRRYSKLIKLREEHHYSCADMAKKLQISESFYWQIEHHKRRLYYDMAVKIAAIFDLKPDDLFY